MLPRSPFGLASVAPLTPGFLVTLDKRALKTPSGSQLLLPKDRRLLATLIANEWENQEQVLKQHALPLVRSWVGLVSFPSSLPDVKSEAQPCGTVLSLSRDSPHIPPSSYAFPVLS